MALVSRPYPGLFGGVSQQQPAMRHPTHCTEQLNGIATAVDGLFKRPGTVLVGTLPLTLGARSVADSYGKAFGHVIDKGDAGMFQLVIVNGNLMLYNMATAAAIDVTATGGTAYLTSIEPGDHFRAVTVADYTFIVNTTKKVLTKAATASTQPVNVAYVVVRTAVPKITYRTMIDGVAYAYYSGDTPRVSDVATGVRNILATAPGYTAYVIPNTTIIKVTRTAGTAFTTTVTADGWGSSTFQTLQDGVDKFSDLPPVFEEGFTIKIRGSADAAADPYYVEWKANRWTEAIKPGSVTELDPATMPHQLRPNGDGTWTFEPSSKWGKRTTGDDVTIPQPSFVGRTIRDVFFFRNRLGFLSGDSVVMSRAGGYYDFFATTATQVLDTDPIDLSATNAEVDSLEWAVPYNKSLLVWSSTRQQFLLTAADILSPDTAQLLPTTSFEAYAGASPQPLGNRVMFVSTSAGYSQVNLYRVSEDTVTNTADDVTEHCPNFVQAKPRMVAASSTAKAAVVIPRGQSNDMWFFKYELDEQDRLTQRAWSKLSFASPDAVQVVNAHWVGRSLHLLLHVKASSDTAPGGRFMLERLDLDHAVADMQNPFGLRLDRRKLVFGGTFDGTNTTVVVPYLAPVTLSLVRTGPAAEPQELTVVSRVANPVTLSTTFTVAGNHAGATIWAGWKFPFRYVFSEPSLQDSQGAPIQSADIKLVKMLVRYVNTGYFQATVTPFLRDPYVYPFVGRNTGQPGQGANQLSLSTGTFAIPVGTNAASTEVAIESTSYMPINLPYAEWVGSLNMKAQR